MTKQELIQKSKNQREKAIDESKEEMLRHTASGPLNKENNAFLSQFDLESIDREGSFKEFYY